MFHKKATAENYAKSTFGAGVGTKGKKPPGRARQLLYAIKHLGSVYGAGHQCLVPGDLADACCRRVTDRDIFQANPGSEILSIMLKYGPARTAFSSAMRNSGKWWSTRVARDLVINGKEMRCRLLYEALVETAKEMSKPCHADELHLWQSHWGRHVSHHSGWLPFLQRHSPSCRT